MKEDQLDMFHMRDYQVITTIVTHVVIGVATPRSHHGGTYSLRVMDFYKTVISILLICLKL